MYSYLKFLATMTVAAVVVALGMASDSGTALAQGPSGQFASGIACVNLSDTPTSASIEFYDQTGSLKTTVSKPDPLAPNAPWLLFTTSIGELGSSFQGSAVVSSGQPTACSVNTQTTTGTQRVGTGEGVSAEEAGPTLYATQVINALGGFSSFVAVQNTSASAVDVTATYYNSSGGQAFQEIVNIPGNASHTFYQDSGNLPVGFIGSATFEAADDTTPLAGVVAMYNDATGQYLSFNTFTQGSQNVILPRLAKNLSGLGYTSGFSCVNVSGGPVNITMNVTMLNQESGTPVNATLTRENLGANTAWAVYLGSPTDTALDNINRGFGSARVQSTGDIACTANEDVRTSPNAGLVGQGSTYGGVPADEASNEMSFPQIVALGADSFRGGFQIANTTGTATTCTYEFSNGDIITDVELPANGANSVFAESTLINNTTNFNGSVKVSCGQPIVGIYNLSIIGEAASGDPFSTNNGINN